MNIEVLSLILFGAFFLLLATGMPMAWVLGGIGMVFTIIILGPTSLVQVALCTWDTMMNFVLIAIALFIFLGFILQESGLAKALYKSMYLWTSRIPGGLGVGTILVCTLIAAMVGTIGAGIVTASTIAMPEMLKRHYNERMVIGLIMAGGTLGILIPPSVGFLVYAACTGLSVGRLLAGGIGPGLLLSALYMIYIVIRCAINPAMGGGGRGKLAPAEEAISWKVRVSSLKDSVPAFLLVFGVLGSIFTGVATPTEAAAVGCFLAFGIAAMYRGLNWRMVKSSVFNTGRLFGMVFWIFACANIFTRFYMGMGLRDYLDGAITTLQINPWLVLIGMMAFIFLAGMIIADIAIVLVCAPIFTELIVSLGFDPLWFGLLFLVNVQIACLSPPFGSALIYMRGCVTDEVGFKGVAWASYPFIAIQIIGLTLCMIFPQIILWLPRQLF